VHGLAGSNYVINQRGRFVLRDGDIAAVDGEPVLVVSDLDDTMIGDDEATAVFKRFWDTMVRSRDVLHLQAHCSSNCAADLPQ
jgi:Sucrose-6F-phosphate phosphohydrolase